MTSPLNIAVLMTVILAALKIAGVTAVSWWVVFSPFLVWIGIVVLLVIFFALKPKRRSRYDRWW